MFSDCFRFGTNGSYPQNHPKERIARVTPDASVFQRYMVLI